ncbi:MAG TPA: Rrf2 family transcriptional regulator [bacterium (Candidatus Stahlbacteria)]|nr:Rrf2 family transcriptional regulator [Candidatus Stahlbacteria bacterium]
MYKICLIYEMATRKVGFMKMSTRSRYGLRMLLDLARYPRDQFIPLRVIASKLGLSKKYLERIARTLESHDLITAVKGVKGGYQLKDDPTGIKISEVLSALEGNLALSECLTTDCARQDDCLASRFWIKLGQNISSYLDRQTLADLMKEA